VLGRLDRVVVVVEPADARGQASGPASGVEGYSMGFAS